MTTKKCSDKADQNKSTVAGGIEPDRAFHGEPPISHYFTVPW